MNHFSWDVSGLNGAEFQALSNALRLRSGGHLEPTFAQIGSEEKLEANDETDNDAASDLVNLISDFSDHVRLKKRFLDRLAELAANEKKPGAVACAAMREFDGPVVVWISRNEGFEERDVWFFGGLW